MFKHLLLSTIFLTAMAAPAFAQQFIFDQPQSTTTPAVNQAVPGTNQAPLVPPTGTGTTPWLDTAGTAVNPAPSSAANYLSNQTAPTATQGTATARTTTSTMSMPFGGSLSLPPTVLDSFVQNAGGQAFQIYGDEGTNGPPPLDNFNYINSAIQSGGLTTGHQSSLPSSWGYPQ